MEIFILYFCKHVVYYLAAVDTCVPDDVVQHHEPLELELELPVVVFG